MKTNKVLIGGIVGGVTFFLLGWLIYGMLMADYMKTNTNQCAMRPMEEMIMWAMILANLASGFMVAYIFNWTNTTTPMAGAKMAGLIGFLLSVSFDLSMYSMSSMFLNMNAVCIDIVVSTVMSAIGGAVVAWAMGMVK